VTAVKNRATGKGPGSTQRATAMHHFTLREKFSARHLTYDLLQDSAIWMCTSWGIHSACNQRWTDPASSSPTSSWSPPSGPREMESTMCKVVKGEHVLPWENVTADVNQACVFCRNTPRIKDNRRAITPHFRRLVRLSHGRSLLSWACFRL